MAYDYYYVHAVATAPFDAGVPSQLIDVSTMAQAVLPAASIVTQVYINVVTALVLTSAVNISVGYDATELNAAQWNAFVPMGTVTSDDIATYFASYRAPGKNLAAPEDIPLVLAVDKPVTGGSISVFMAFLTRDCLPD